MDGLAFDTRAVHAGRGDESGRSVAVPIFQTATFELADAAAGARFAASTQPSEWYTRWGNPTTAALERAIASLEGAEAALATASGMGAIHTVLETFVAPGDHVVAASSLYSATIEILRRREATGGVAVTWIDAAEDGAIGRALRPATRLVYLETPSNPTLAITDLGAAAGAVRAAAPDAVTVADNTFATPFNQRPLALGIDLVVHSATKYLGGHSDVVAGAVAGRADLVARVWKTHTLVGAVADPFAAWLVLRGVRTLGLRMARHNASAQALAEWLEQHPKVARVHYPGLASHPGHARARAQMTGFGGVLSFSLEGGFEPARRLVEGLAIVRLAVSLGGVDSLVSHPASMTAGYLTDEDRRRAGIDPGLVRLSAGIEDCEDLRRDLEQALAKA